ncbi:MAG TPA: hypothetical protein VF581_11710 [Flavobacterium sp.]|jgi:hypothetical protein
MNEALAQISMIINESLIKGLSISVLVVMFSRLIFRHKVDVQYAFAILKWIVIVYSVLVVIGTLLLLVFPQAQYSFIERATGPYWWAYWTMFILHAVLPQLLIIKRMGQKPFVLLIISILINIGWILELIIIRSSGCYADFAPENHTSSLLTSSEYIISVKGFTVGVLALAIGNIIASRRNIH